MNALRPIALRLRKPLERVLRAGHPWVYRDALEPFGAAPGTVATVRDGKGRFVGRGLVDDGPIGIRVFTTEDEPLDGDLIARRLAAAQRWRKTMLPPQTDAYRLVHGEGDRLPGVVCDVYGRAAVLAFDGAALEPWSDTVRAVFDPVLRELGIETVLLRQGRRADRTLQVLRGDMPQAPLEVREHGMSLQVDLAQGQKTGLFLDHRESRRRVRMLSHGARVLDLYAYVGGFSVAAGLGGAASVDTVDLAPAAVAAAAANWRANALDPRRQHVHVADVPTWLTDVAGRNERYDVIIADPPSFAPNERVLQGALRGYRALHRACLRLLEPGGYYVAASCSSHVRRVEFERTLYEAADKLGVVLQVLDRWDAPPDHPRLLVFPEGDYLKVTLVRRLA